MPPTQTKRENPWLNLGFNIILPILILGKGANWLPFLEPWAVMVFALSFPVGYFIYDLRVRRKANGFSIIGGISVLLTGGIGLLKLSPLVFALKETAIPLIFGLAIVASLKTRNPLIRMLILNPSVMDVDKINQALDTPEKKSAFHRLLVLCTWIVASSFLVSAVLNFIISRMIVQTDPNIDQALFNAEIAKQTGVTWIVITVATLPLMIVAMWKLFAGIKQLTGYGLEDIVIDGKK